MQRCPSCHVPLPPNGKCPRMDTWNHRPSKKTLEEENKREDLFLQEHPDGASLQEIADFMGCSKQDVGECLDLAMRKLRMRAYCKKSKKTR